MKNTVAWMQKRIVLLNSFNKVSMELFNVYAWMGKPFSPFANIKG
jgi:hypothetical protein